MTYAKLFIFVLVTGMVGCSGVDTNTKIEVSVSNKKSRKPAPSKPVLPNKVAHDPISTSSTNPPTDSAEQAISRTYATANREAALAIAESYRCSVCHKIEGKLLGPSWKAVARKYQADPDAVSKLSVNIRRGGNFGWKSGLMPAKGGSKITEEEITRLAEFITSLK